MKEDDFETKCAKIAEKIVKTRKLHSDLVEYPHSDDGDIWCSIRFWYKYDRIKYILWVDYNQNKKEWQFNDTIFDITNDYDLITKDLQDNSDVRLMIDDFIVDLKFKVIV